jgi:hypothetical protein
MSLDFDHFFGLSVLLDRFPGTRAIASPKSVKLMHEQLQTAAFAPRGHSTLGGDHPDAIRHHQGARRCRNNQHTGAEAGTQPPLLTVASRRAPSSAAA